MKLASSPADAAAWAGGLVAIGRFAGEGPTAAEKALDGALGGALLDTAERLRFSGKAGQAVRLDTLGRAPAAQVLVLGLGERAKLTPAGLRDVGAAVVEAAQAGRHEAAAFAVPEGVEARFVAEGALLGAYRWEPFKKKDPDEPPARLARLDLLGASAAPLERAEVLADAVNLARTLVNEPPNVCTPTRLAALAAEIAGECGLTLRVLGPDEMHAMGMGGLLAVSAGSGEPPRLIHLTYVPPGGSPEGGLAFVGKGLTFDSGGLSIKPWKSMADMHIDMAGGAAVIGAMKAIGRLKPGVTVHGIVGACENMPDGKSYRPSDILTMASGRTVEVLNTDAEGRLVLADCLHYASQHKPAAVVDLATLTGACMVALGEYHAGLFTDDETLAADLLAAAREAGELLWRLPIDPKLAPQLKSQRADLKNLGGSWGGAITAALFLKEFAGDAPWAHLDIAGPAHTEKAEGHIRAGGTGFGVMTLWRLVERAAKR